MERYKLLRQTVEILPVTLAVMACMLVQPYPASTAGPATATTGNADHPASTDTCSPIQPTGRSYLTQITISTNSDQTALRLIAGGTWYDAAIAMTSGKTTTAEFDGDRFILSQSMGRASAGEVVELSAVVRITGLDPQVPLQFEIEQGRKGSSRVTIVGDPYGTPREIADFTWSGADSGERNAQVYEVSPEAFIGTTPNDYIVIGQLNFWYYGPDPGRGFVDRSGNRMTPLTPLLGDYWSSDPSVVYQQIEWAMEYGVDAFSIEWTTPRGEGTSGSMEDTLDDVFLKSPNVHKIRWAIDYDFILRLDQTPDLDIGPGGVNFDKPDVYNTFVSDFVHFALKYFHHPQYLTIDGRPVIYIWATFQYRGDLAGAVREARERVAELGYDVYIVGDEVCYGCFHPNHAALFDANTSFTFLIPGLSHTWSDVGKAAQAMDGAYQWWRDRIDGLQVAGREELVNFQPGWAPQYDERRIVFTNPKYIPATGKDQVIAVAEVARKHAQPAGSSGLRLIWLNTWNNWAETTTVEPTADLGPKYPAGNYQFDMLEVVREVFGRGTFYTSPPA
jgi:hypothetical protein